MKYVILIALGLILTGCSDKYYPLSKNSLTSGYSVVYGHSKGYDTLDECEAVLGDMRLQNIEDGVATKPVFCSTDKTID